MAILDRLCCPEGWEHCGFESFRYKTRKWKQGNIYTSLERSGGEGHVSTQYFQSAPNIDQRHGIAAARLEARRRWLCKVSKEERTCALQKCIPLLNYYRAERVVVCTKSRRVKGPNTSKCKNTSKYKRFYLVKLLIEFVMSVLPFFKQLMDLNKKFLFYVWNKKRFRRGRRSLQPHLAKLFHVRRSRIRSCTRKEWMSRFLLSRVGVDLRLH